jgi:hypothetical protein
MSSPFETSPFARISSPYVLLWLNLEVVLEAEDGPEDLAAIEPSHMSITYPLQRT